MLYMYCKLAQHNDKVLSLALFSLIYSLTRKIKNKKIKSHLQTYHVQKNEITPKTLNKEIPLLKMKQTEMGRRR